MSPYWYEGRCPYSGEWLRLPRTDRAEAIARDLMQELAQDESFGQEGKMYGILLVTTPTGNQGVLKAFSGVLNGRAILEGWVPPMLGHEAIAQQERQTLASLETFKQEMITLNNHPSRQLYQSLCQEFDTQWQVLLHRHQHHKQQRDQQRQTILETLVDEPLSVALDALNEQSRQDGRERRRFKRDRDVILKPLQSQIAQLDAQIQALKQQRKDLSRQLQAQMHAQYRLTNFAGRSLPLQQLMPNGAPTGTGDCCAPKLLHYAATQGFRPLAMAEFWWGSPSARGDKVPGTFYGACAERCQPLMGFLLSGITTPKDYPDWTLPILYTDQWMIAVDKPAGLLSVPGRTSDCQDSVLSRLRQHAGDTLTTVHRLDQDTSGVLLLARDRQTYRHLSQQFQQRQVHKVYEAILAGPVTATQKYIDLPLWGDPSDRPRQSVNWQYGKPSTTQFQVINSTDHRCRVECVPITGRTHQIRVHAADPNGLGVPIWGDRLYGSNADGDRLYLHARELRLVHPHSGQILCLHSKTPF